jgi:hypothetical protein
MALMLKFGSCRYDGDDNNNPIRQSPDQKTEQTRRRYK